MVDGDNNLIGVELWNGAGVVSASIVQPARPRSIASWTLREQLEAGGREIRAWGECGCRAVVAVAGGQKGQGGHGAGRVKETKLKLD